MKTRSSLPSALAFALVLASVSAVTTAAHADEAVADDLAPPETVPTHVLVHIDSPEPVQLESRVPGQRGWATVCGVPCDRELPLADEYRIAYGRKGASSEKPFRLEPGAKGTVELKVRPASTGGKVGGGALIGLGAGVGILGVLGIAVGLPLASEPDGPCKADRCFGGSGIGLLIAGVGLAGLLVGGGMIAGGAAIVADSEASTTQKPWSGREPSWVGPQSSAPKKAELFVPLSFSF